jgi:hypothetical protein
MSGITILAAYNAYRRKQSSPHFMNAVLPLSIGTQPLPSYTHMPAHTEALQNHYKYAA